MGPKGLLAVSVFHTYGYDPYLTVKYAWGLDRHVRHVSSLSEIWATCDYVTIHVPANETTRGMVGREAIAAMRDGVVVLNYARDSLVDEVAMSDALRAGHVHRYMTDFANSITTQMKHAVVTPHLGASTKESEDNCAIMAADELRDYLENGNIVNSVNYPSVDMGPMEGVMRLAVFHMNEPGVIGQVTSIVSEAGGHINNMADRSRGELAYCLLDLDELLDRGAVERIAAIDGVFRVREIGR